MLTEAEAAIQHFLDSAFIAETRPAADGGTITTYLSVERHREKLDRERSGISLLSPSTPRFVRDRTEKES